MSTSHASERVPSTSPEVVDERGASLIVGLAPSSLRTLRSRRRGPPWVKVGRRVVYRVADLRAWLEARLVTPPGAATTEASS